MDRRLFAERRGGTELSRGNINDTVTFVTAVNSQSFSVAGKQLGLTRSAVANSVVRLEERLGVRLLNRTPRSLSLTGDGEVFYRRCVKILKDLDVAEAAMPLRSEVPMDCPNNLPVVLGQQHVLLVVQEFLATWPLVRADLTFTDLFVDLIDEGVDRAVRIGAPQDDPGSCTTAADCLCITVLSERERHSEKSHRST